MQIKTDISKYDVGVVVGRFQVDMLHPGHIELLDWVKNNHPTMIVVIGNSVVQNRSNPLPYNARRVMIQAAYPEAIIIPLGDTRYDHTWSTALDAAISPLIRPTESLCLYGSRDSFISHYVGKYPSQELEGTGHHWNGTEIRNKVSKKVLESPEFRAGVIYASNGDYPRVISTVDIILHDEGEKHFFMVRKNGEDKFRFAGGYAEPGSTFIETARREIKEEVGDVEVDLKYFTDMEIDDWRYRGEKDTIHTTVFKGKVLWGRIGSHTDINEISEVRSFTLTNLSLGYKESIVVEHWPIVEYLMNYYKNLQQD